MATSKPERHAQELLIHSSRHEAGIHAVHQWLCRTRDEINAAWPEKMESELASLQGEAKLVARLIRVIETGPTIKSLEGTKT